LSILLSLVLPTYQESKSISTVIDKVCDTLTTISDVTFEIIVVDDDSPDGTWRVALSKCSHNEHIRVIRRQGERGLATAICDGWRASHGQVLGVMDADLQHPPDLIGRLLEEIEMGADVVVASRHVKGAGVNGWSPFRRVASWISHCLASAILPEVLDSIKDPKFAAARLT
jgi:dolichol-phosphate mannosyltransferase